MKVLRISEKHMKELNALEESLQKVTCIEIKFHKGQRNKALNRYTVRCLRQWTQRYNAENVAVTRVQLVNDHDVWEMADRLQRHVFTNKVLKELMYWPRPLQVHVQYLCTALNIDYRKQAIQELYFTSYEDWANIETQRRSLLKRIHFAYRNAPFERALTKERTILKIIKNGQDGQWKRFLDPAYRAEQWPRYMHPFSTDYHRLNLAAVRDARRVYTLLMMAHKRGHALWAKVPSHLICHLLKRYCKEFHWRNFEQTRTLQTGQWMDEIFFSVKRIREASSFVSFKSVKRLRTIIEQARNGFCQKKPRLGETCLT